MTIGIDGVEANVPQKVGTSVYTFEMLKYFQAHATSEVRFVVYLRSQPLSDMPAESAHFRYVVVPNKGFWRDVFFPFYLYTHKEIDVLFCPAHYTPRWCPVPTVVTIHDLAYEYFPGEFLKEDLYKLRIWTRAAVQKSQHIIAVSDATADDLKKLYHVPTNKMDTIYNGYTKVTSGNNIAEFGLQSRKYFLYIGTVQPRKNLIVLLDAFSTFHAKNPTIKLAIVGKKGWLYEKIFDRVKELKLEEAVVFTGFVPHIKELYTHAAAYVLPSLYEGFGVPILEAMSCSCPVIISNTPALVEIGGDACLTFDPHDTMALEKLLEKVQEKDVRKKLIESGLKRSAQFSWENAAERTLDIIKNTLVSSNI